MTDLTKRLRARRMIATAGQIGVGKTHATNAWITDSPDPDCTEAADEIERLTNCLTKANIATEHFERLWYMGADELEREQQKIAGPQAQTAPVPLTEEQAQEMYDKMFPTSWISIRVLMGIVRGVEAHES